LPAASAAAASATATTAKDVELRAEMAELRLLAFRAINTAEGASSVADRASTAADTSVLTARELLAKIEQSNGSTTSILTAPSRREVVTTAAVNFKFNRWDLDDAAQTALLDVIDDLREHPDRMVNLEGYADPVGSYAYNIGLSERRAAAVVRYLVAKGVELSRIHWVGLGILDGPGTPAEQAKKRRVTIKLMAATSESHP
jgi:outer membrane protein OmpA-like peptidoglycan-associated protein